MTAHPTDIEALLARIARLEAQTDIRGRAVVIYRDRARKAEAERDWNIRSSRLAKEERIKANARAEKAEARIRDLTQEVRDERGAALDALEQIKVRDARIKAVRDAHRKWTVGDPCDKRQGCGGADCAPHVSGHGDKVWRHWRDDCAGCAATWPCPTVRALDGDA